MQITIKTSVKAKIEKVWLCWITPEDINHWNTASDEWHNPRSTNDLRVGGRFTYRMEAKDGSQGFDFAGTYTKIKEHKLIEYVLDDRRSVNVEFSEANGLVQIVETFEVEDEHSAKQQLAGWQSILNNFTDYVESKT